MNYIRKPTITCMVVVMGRAIKDECTGDNRAPAVITYVHDDSGCVDLTVFPPGQQPTMLHDVPMCSSELEASRASDWAAAFWPSVLS